MILFVDQSGQVGGAELCMADLAAHFLPGARVLLLADGPLVSRLRQRGIPAEVHPLPGSVGRATKRISGFSLLGDVPALAGCIWKLRKAFRPADVVYLNTAKALLLGSAANALARCPCLFHLHDLWDETHFSRLNIRLLVAAANRMDAVIANSRTSADAFRKAGGRRPVHVIPNGFDSRPFDSVAPEAVRGLREKWNPSGGPVAAVFGRLARWKGQHLLIEAARRLPGLTVWIVGEALFTEDDAAYAAELRHLAEDLGPRVRFLGFCADIPALMTAADIVVHCSTSPEPFGRVIVEGMLARKPVIAADAGGPRELVRTGTTGLLFPASDVGALVSALESLLSSPGKARQMGLAGREVAGVDYSLERVCAETGNIIRSMEKR